MKGVNELGMLNWGGELVITTEFKSRLLHIIIQKMLFSQQDFLTPNQTSKMPLT